MDDLQGQEDAGVPAAAGAVHAEERLHPVPARHDLALTARLWAVLAACGDPPCAGLQGAGRRWRTCCPWCSACARRRRACATASPCGTPRASSSSPPPPSSARRRARRPWPSVTATHGAYSMLQGGKAPSMLAWCQHSHAERQMRQCQGSELIPYMAGMQVLTVARSLAKGAPFRCIALTGTASLYGW